MCKLVRSFFDTNTKGTQPQSFFLSCSLFYFSLLLFQSINGESKCVCKQIGWAISSLNMTRLGTLVPLNNHKLQPMFTFYGYSTIVNLRLLRPATSMKWWPVQSLFRLRRSSVRDRELCSWISGVVSVPSRITQLRFLWAWDHLSVFLIILSR